MRMGGNSRDVAVNYPKKIPKFGFLAGTLLQIVTKNSCHLFINNIIFKIKFFFMRLYFEDFGFSELGSCLQ